MRMMKSQGRGFTLVELAIVLAVVGLLMGAALMPMRVLDESRQREAERARLQRAVDAIAGYAIRHRTAERDVHFVGANITDAAIRVAGGRPYLPCPDVDGDGFEDREPRSRGAESDGYFLQGMEVTVAAVTMQMVVSNNRPQRALSSPVYGGCASSRGTLPWRTLGVPPADGWGNRHTYYADPVFASALFGFDGRSVANIYDSRLPGGLRLSPPLRSGRTFDAGLGANNPVDYPCPAVICNGGRGNGTDVNACLRAAANGCAWASGRAGDVVLKAGALARENIGDFSSEVFPEGGVLDGVPFVVVSHGPNGRGAVNHWASLFSPIGAGGVKGPICNREGLVGTEAANGDVLFAGSYPVDNHEAQNAIRYAPGNGAAPTERRCYPFRGVDSATDITGVELKPWVFVWEPQGGDYARRRYDDLLMWMTREELHLALGNEEIPALSPLLIADITP